ncbi:MAG: pilus assembly PilX N-terminal domain-containing protein [Candidatus Margulisiibacteriota bacterium]
MRQQKGFALLSVIFVMLVFSVLAVGITMLVVSESRLAVEEGRYNKAFFIAEAGKNFAAKRFMGHDDWTEDMGLPMSMNFGGGCFTISTTGETREELDLFSTGVITEEGRTYSRRIRAHVAMDWPAPFKYVIFWDNTAGTVSTVLELGTLIRGIDVIWDVIAKGKVRVRSSSTVTGGTIYAHASGTAPQVVVDSGAVVESWEAISDFPAFPVMDYSYYDNLIASYEAVLPPATTTLDIALTSANSPYNLNTSPYNSGGVIQCRSFTAQDCLVYGNAIIAARNSINISAGTIVSPEGGSIVFASSCEASGSGINVGGGGVLIRKGPSNVDYGVIFFNRARTLNFLNLSMHAYKILALTKNAISTTLAPNILDNSIFYSQAEEDTITFTEVGSFEGSILSRGQVYLYAGRITGIVFNNSSWGTLAELVLGSYVHGPMISRQFRNNRIAGGLWFGSEAAWDPIYLPEIPRGISVESVVVTDWQEVY